MWKQYRHHLVQVWKWWHARFFPEPWLIIAILFVGIFVFNNEMRFVKTKIDSIAIELGALRIRTDEIGNKIERISAIADQLQRLSGDAKDVSRNFDQLTRSSNEISASLDKIAKSLDRISPSGGILNDLSSVLDVLRGTGKLADEASVKNKVIEFLQARGVKASDTVVEELTKAAMCSLIGVSCSQPVNITFPPINLNVPPIELKEPAVIVAIERPDATSPSPQVRSYMTVWFSKINSTHDGGVTDRHIVPRIKHIIGTRNDCAIFVDGHADSLGEDEFNKELAGRRAQIISATLSKHFGKMVDSTRQTFGERSLFSWTADGQPNIANRRADILVTCG
jgi:hypothetical protein